MSYIISECHRHTVATWELVIDSLSTVEERGHPTKLSFVLLPASRSACESLALSLLGLGLPPDIFCPIAAPQGSRRSFGACRAVLGVQQVLEEVMQHLVLRGVRRAPGERRRRGTRTPAEAEATRSGARAAPARARSSAARRTTSPNDRWSHGRRHGYGGLSAEDSAWTASRAPCVLAVLFRLFWRRVV